MRICKKIIVVFIMALAFIIMPKSELCAQSQDQFKFALDFLQKYKEFLNQTQNDSIVNILRKTKEYGFKYLKGNDIVFKSLKNDTDYSISFTDGKYLVSWIKDGKTILECQFPANYGMLTFSNKIDLEKSMADKISNIKASPNNRKVDLIPKYHLDPVAFSDLYIKDNGFYITPRLRNLIVYEISEFPDTCQLLTTPNGMYLLESVQNMMLTGNWPKPININLNLSEYGYKKTTFHKPFGAFYDILEKEGSIPYWGVESFDGSIIKGVYVWRNEPGGFNHVMSVEIPVHILEKGGDINANLFCYIRTDNLKALFQEFM